MTIDQEHYENLQSKWRQLAIKRKRQYLQYLAPRARVDFVLAGKMTSIGEKDAAEIPPGEYPDIDPPGYNLLTSIGDLILNYGAHRHLCQPGERYYLTDLGKGAVPPKYAKGKTQKEEFTAWYPMLLEELKLVAKPDTTVVPIGSATGDFLRAQPNFPYRLTTPILHWSRAAVSAAKMAGSLFPREWDEYRRSTSWEDLRTSTEEIFIEAGLGQHMDAVHRCFKDKFREFHAHYMFTYKKEMPLKRPDACYLDFVQSPD
ncbi:MAG: hypothetical protein J4G13_12820 [Dehalococcoidia bacterium]|nr:hypothetical protein [Dehalococcoidia bacterium]